MSLPDYSGFNGGLCPQKEEPMSDQHGLMCACDGCRVRRAEWRGEETEQAREREAALWRANAAKLDEQNRKDTHTNG